MATNTRDFTQTHYHKTQMDLPWLERYYVDADFKDEAGRCKRYLGHVPDMHDPGKYCSIFEDVHRQKVIPKAEWQGLYDEMEPNYAHRKTWQYDQNGEGTCTSNASAGAYCYQFAKTYPMVHAMCPSPPSMYYYCASGPNSGSSTSCILKRVRDYGCLPIDTPNNRKFMSDLGLDSSHVLPAVGWNGPRRLSEDAISKTRTSGTTASNFRLDEFYEITTVEGFFSALLHGFSILYGRSGHAIHGVDIVKRSGQWACKYDNSWGRWGENGFGFDTYDYIRRTSAYRWAYAFQSIIAPSGIEKLAQISPPV